MRTIKNRNYQNFLVVMRFFQTVKHYDKETAERLTRQTFDNWEAVKGTQAERDIWTFADRVLTREEFEAAY